MAVRRLVCLCKEEFKRRRRRQERRRARGIERKKRPFWAFGWSNLFVCVFGLRVFKVKPKKRLFEEKEKPKDKDHKNSREHLYTYMGSVREYECALPTVVSSLFGSSPF